MAKQIVHSSSWSSWKQSWKCTVCLWQSKKLIAQGQSLQSNYCHTVPVLKTWELGLPLHLSRLPLALCLVRQLARTCLFHCHLSVRALLTGQKRAKKNRRSFDGTGHREEREVPRLEKLWSCSWGTVPAIMEILLLHTISLSSQGCGSGEWSKWSPLRPSPDRIV